jgi:predicted site-specific integrase-resolvase
MSGYIYGYARVSTRSQELNRQLDLLNEQNCNEILTEKMTGTKADRPQLNRLKGKTCKLERKLRYRHPSRPFNDDSFPSF